MRLELRDGQWAELRERISHGADKRIKIAYRKGKADIEGDTALEIDDVIIREFVTAWNVIDVDGSAIPLDDPDATNRLPDDISDALALQAANLYSAATVPNAPTPD